MPDISITRQTRGVVNWYIVREGDKVTLVDAGIPKDWDLLERSLTGMGLLLSAVDTVLLTHAHSDHTGFTERLRVEAGATARVHEGDAGAAKGGPLGKHEAGFRGYLWRPEAYRTLI